MPALSVSARRRETAAPPAPPLSLPADLPAVAASPVFACGRAEAQRRGADRLASLLQSEPRPGYPLGVRSGTSLPPPRSAHPAAARQAAPPEPSPMAPRTVGPPLASTPAAAAQASDPPPPRSALQATQSEPRPLGSVASHPPAQGTVAPLSASAPAAAAQASDPPPSRSAHPAAVRQEALPEQSPSAPGTGAPLSASLPLHWAAASLWVRPLPAPAPRSAGLAAHRPWHPPPSFAAPSRAPAPPARRPARIRRRNLRQLLLQTVPDDSLLVRPDLPVVDRLRSLRRLARLSQDHPRQHTPVHTPRQPERKGTAYRAWLAAVNHPHALQPRRFGAVAVGWRQLLHVLDGPLPRQILGHVLVELAQSPDLRPLPQHRAEELHVRYRLRHLETHLPVLEVRVAVSPCAPQPLQCPVIGNRQIAQFRRHRRQVVVIEEFHFPPQVLLFFVQAQDLEAPLPARQDVHPPVRIHLQHFVHLHRTAGVQDPVLSGQHDPELGTVPYRVARHLLVAVFENVQRKVDPREDHELQGEQRNQP